MTRAQDTTVTDNVVAIIEAFGSELPDPAKPLSLIVRFEVKADDGEQVEAAFARAIPETRAEPGCRVFTLNRDPREPGRFTVYEQWRSLADLETHLRTDYITRLRGEIDAVILGAPEFKVLLPIV